MNSSPSHNTLLWTLYLQTKSIDAWGPTHTLDYILNMKSLSKKKITDKKIWWPPVRGGKEKNELELSAKRINYLFQDVCMCRRRMWYRLGYESEVFVWPTNPIHIQAASHVDAGIF